MTKRNTHQGFSPARIFAAMAAACVFGQAHAEAPAENALPTGGQVTAGQAQISQNGNTMNIDQSSQRAVVNWSSFDVGSKAAVNFNQPNAQAATLNIVNGASKSMINGAVNANGQVIFVNNNGVVFGKHAEVNVGGMVATTMNVDQQKFMNGDEKLTFTGDGTGKVVNKGHLNVTSLNGYIALMAPEVKNEGVITAMMSGENAIALVSGQKVSLTFSGNQLVSVQVDASSIKSLIQNKRLIQTNGGQVIIAANSANELLGSVIKNTGVISATGISKKGGVISLIGDTVKQAGNVTANSDTHEGGKVTISGNNVTLASGSNTTATGTTQGGQILVGTTVAKPVLASNSSSTSTTPIAKNVTVEAGASVDASATQKGNGGTIAIWSQIKTIVAGNLTAKAGTQGGNGGNIETSSVGKVAVAQTAKIDTSAAHGKAGNWTIDPVELVVDQAAATAISNALNNSNVTLDATLGGCAGFGVCTNSATAKITFNADARIASSNVQTALNLIATGGEINFNSVIESGSINAVADTINVNATATLTAIGGNTGNILLAGANLNILGVINANGSTGNSSSTSSTSAGAASAAARRRTGVDSGLTADLNTYLSNGGNVQLSATGDILISTNASVTANGLNGGSINIVSQNGTVNVQGVVDAVGTQNAGGNVIIAGQTATVMTGALVSVAGLSFGGQLQIGVAQNIGSGTTTAPPAVLGSVAHYLPSALNVLSQTTWLDSNTGISASTTIQNNHHQAGQIYVAGNTSLISAATIYANGDNGGLVLMVSPLGNNQNTGYIQTNGGAGLGGTIVVSGLNSTTLTGANFEANGTNGGGYILIGRDFKNNTLPGSAYLANSIANISAVLSVPTSHRTDIDSTTTLSANAITQGNGGAILAWGDVLYAHGTFTARGGSLNGNGGLVETSGADDVDVTGFQISTSAPNGQAGTWLLDPADTQPSALTQVAFQTVLTAGNNVVYVSSAAISAPAMSLSSPGGMLNVTFDTRGASKKNITLGAITDTSSVAGAGIHLNVYSAGSAITASAISVKGALTIDNTYQVGGTVSGYITRSNAASLAVGNHGVTLNGNVTAAAVTVNAANISVSGWSYYSVNVPTAATTITSQSGAMRFEGTNGLSGSASVLIYASLNSAAGITVLANGMAGGPNNHLAILGTSITASGDMLFQSSQIAPTSNGINISSTITQNASGGNISFIANSVINQTGAITMVANTSGVDSAVTYDTTSGTKTSSITGGALTLTAGSTSAINYVMKSAAAPLNPGAIGSSTIRLPGYVLLDNTFGCLGTGCTPATGYFNVNNIAVVATIPTTSVGVTVNGAIYTTGNITAKGIASGTQGINYSALMNSSAGDISLTGTTTSNYGVYGTVGLTANNITILGLASAAPAYAAYLNAMTINSTSVGGNVSVTGTVLTAGGGNGVYQSAAISGASGTSMTFVSNNIINQTGVITLAANTSGTASLIKYDTSTGTKLSTITTGALSVTGTSTSAINYWIKASGAYINPNTINVPGYITIDNTYLNGASGGITSANLATYATTGYGIQINNALTAGTNLTIKAINNSGNNAILAQAAMIATNGDIELVGTGTTSYVIGNVIQNVQWYTAPLTATNGAIRITGTATTGTGIIYGNNSGKLTAMSITINGTTNSGSYATYLGDMEIVAGGDDIYITGTNVTNGAAGNSGIYQAFPITVNGSGSNITFISNGVINQTGAIALVANTSANASTILYDTTSGTKASNITAGALTLAAGSTNLVNYTMKSAGSALNPNALNVTGAVLLDNTFGGTTPATGYITASNLATLATASAGVTMNNVVTADRGITIKGISNGGYGISFTAAITSTTQAISLMGTSTISSGVYASSAGSIVALSDQVTIVGRSTTGQAVQLASPLTGNAISITANGTTAATITSLAAMTVNTVYSAGSTSTPTFISLSSSATNGTYIGTISGASLPTLTTAALAGSVIGTGAAAIQSATVIYAMAGNTAMNANYLIGWGTAGATKMAQLNLQLIGTQVIATTMAAKTSTTTLTTGSGTNIQTLWTGGTAATAQATSLATAGIGISNIAFAGTTFTNNSSGNLSVEAYNTAAGSNTGISQTGVINVNASGANITFKSNNKISQTGQINLAANTSGVTSNVLYDTTLGNRTSDIVAGILVNPVSTSAVNYLMKAAGAAIDPAVTVSGSVVLDNTYGCTGTGCTPVSGYITLANAATLATTGVGVTTTGNIAAGTYVTLKGISSGSSGVVLGGEVLAVNGDVTIDGYSTAAGSRAVDMPTAFGAYAYNGNILVRATKSVASTLTAIYMQGSSASAPLVLSASGNIDVIGYAPSSSTSIIYSTSAVFVAGGNITLSASTGGTTDATVSLNSTAIKTSGALTIQGASLVNNVATAAPGAAVSAAGKGIYLTTAALTIPVGRPTSGSYTGIVAASDIWMAATTTGAYDAIYSSSPIASNTGSVTLIGVAGGSGGKGVSLAANVVAGASNGVIYSASGNLATPTMISTATPIGQVSGSTLPTLIGAAMGGNWISNGTTAINATVVTQVASAADSATYLVGVNDGVVKMVQVQITKSGNNVYASTTGARYYGTATVVSSSNIQSMWDLGTLTWVAPTLSINGYGAGNLTFDNSVAISALALTDSNINISGTSTNATTGYGVYVAGGGTATTPVVLDAVGNININGYLSGASSTNAYVIYTTSYTLFKSGGDFTISASTPNVTATGAWTVRLTNTSMKVGGNFTLQGATLSTLTNANGSSAGATIANVATAAASTAANFGGNHGAYFESAVSLTYGGVSYANIDVTGNISITTKTAGVSIMSFYNNTPMTAGGTLTIDATATGNNAYAVFLNSGTLTSTGLMSITGRTATGRGIIGVYNVAASPLISAGGISITGLGAIGGTTGHINMAGAITNTGTTGTGITISSTYNTSLGNVTNSGANGIRITGGVGIAAGTVTGGTITGLGIITNTGGIVAISMAQPVSPYTVEGKVGVTTANASMANIRYSVQGGNFTSPTLYASGNYVNYRSNIASYTASATVLNYSQPYGTAYNESTALNWLRTGTNVTLTVPTLPFGISLASIKAGLVWNSTIGTAAVNANIVQTSTALNAGSIKTADGVNITISSGTPTYTITRANLTITDLASSTTYDGVTTYANLVSAAGYTVTGLVTSIGGVATGDAVSSVTQTIKSGSVVGSGSTVSGVAQAGSFNAVPSVATGSGLANYNITYVGVGSTVAKAPLTITALADSKVYGETSTTLGLTYLPNDGWAESTNGAGYSITAGRLLGSDTLTKVYLYSSGYKATAGVANNWTLTPGWVDPDNIRNNYNVSYASANLAVTPRPLTITASSQTTTYGTALNLGTSAFTTSGLVNGDSITAVTLKYNTATTVPGTLNAGAYTGVITPSAAVGTGNAINQSDSLSSGNLTSTSLETNNALVTYNNYTITYVAGNLTVNQKALTLSLNAQTKVYDATAFATLNSAAYNLTGFANGESATINQTIGTYNSLNVANATTVSAALTSSNYVAATGTLLSNYILPTTASGAGTITKATLTITADSAAKFMGQADPAFTYTYSGLQGTDTLATAAGTVSVVPNRTTAVLFQSGGSGVMPASGSEVAGRTYLAALMPSASAISGNYLLNAVGGDYSIAGAGQLIVKVGNTTVSYGTYSNATNLAVAIAPSVTALYCNIGSSCGAGDIQTLTKTSTTSAGTNIATFVAEDALSPKGIIQFNVALNNATPTSYSSGGYLNVGAYTMTPSSATPVSAQINYENNNPTYPIIYTSGTVTVTPLTLTVSNNSAPTKQYDTTTSMSGVVLTATNALTNDVLSLSGFGTYNAASAGTSLGYTIANIQALGADAANYVLASSTISGTNGVITKAPVTISGLAANDKVYDASSTVTLNGTPTVFGALEAVTISSGSATTTFNSMNVADNIAVTANLSSLVLSNSNYEITGVTSPLVADITPARITVTATSAYNGGLTLAQSDLTVAGIAGQTLTFGAGTTATLTNPNVNSAAFASLNNAVLANGTGGSAGLASNYTLVNPILSTVTITPANITVSASNAVKTYNQSTSIVGATTVPAPILVSGTLYTNAATGLADTLSGGSFVYTNANAGSGNKTLQVSSVGVMNGAVGANANYNITYQNNTTSTINPLGVTLSGLTAVDRAYNGGTSAVISGTPTVIGVLSGDALTLSGSVSSGTFADSNAANNIPVTPVLSGLTLSNANYVITGTTSALSADITPKEITFTGSVTKMYDGTTSLTGVTVSTGVGSETLTLTNATANSANVGAGNFISAATLGNCAGVGCIGLAANYILPVTLDANTAPANITSVALLVTADNQSMTYGDGSLPTFTATITGFVNGENTSVISGAASLTTAATPYNGSTAGSASTAGTYAITAAAGTLSATNYSFSYAAGTLTVNKANLTITASDDGKVYGSTATVAGVTYVNGVAAGATAGFTHTGLVNGDTLSSVTLTSAGGNATANVADGPFVITPSAASGSTRTTTSNYNITYAPASTGLSVTPLTLTLTGSNAAPSRAYNGLDALANMTLSTGVGSETITLTNVSANSANVGSGNYIDAATISSGTGTASNYALPTLNASNAPVSITPAPLSISGTKTYDATTSLSTNQVTLTGLIGLETLTFTGAAANDANVASASYISAMTLANGTNGGLAANYALPSLSAASARNTATITPMTLDLSGSTVTRAYDGSDDLANIAVSTGIGSQTVTLTSVSAYSANVGSGNYIDAATITSGTGSASNYALPTLNATNVPVSITPKDLSIAGVKTYDATTDFTSAQVTLTGLVGSQALTVSGVTSSSSNVVTLNKYLTAITLTDGTGLSANYALPSLSAYSARNTATINPLTLTLTGSNAASSRAYNGTDALANMTISTGVGSETITLTNVSANSANVGAGNYIDAATITSGAGTASNYALPTLNAANAPVSITPKDLSIAGVKTYDATTGLSSNQVTLTGLVGSETLAISGAAANDANVASASYISAMTLANGTNGGLAANYALPDLTTASVRNTATINPLTLTLNNAATTSVYNGTDALADITVSTGVGSQTIILTNVSAYSKNVGSGNYIDVATITSGTGTASNYALPTLNAANAPASITPKPVTLTAPSINKVYDGGYTYTLTSADLAQMNAQLVGADTVNAATAIFVGSNPNVGANKAVTLSSVTINDGNNGANYSVTYANSTGAVTPASLVVTAADDAKFVSQVDNSLNNYAGALYRGFVNGETAADLTGALVINRTNASVGTVGNYPGVLQPSGLTSNNYQISYVNGSYTIVAAENLLIRAAAVTTYGSAPTYSFTAQYLAADNTTISYIGFTGTSPSASAINLSAAANRTGVATFTLDDGGTQATLAIGPSGATLSGSGNVNVGQYNAMSAATPTYSNATPSFRGVTVVGQLQVDPLVIAAPTLAPNSISKVYDGNAVISGIDTAAASSQLLAGDAVAISANGIYSDKNVANNKSVTVNFALSGAEAGNYVMANTQVTGNYGQITQLASVTYVGPSGGNWSTANNWAGGAIPDYSNVANVIIPTNTTVHFDSAVGGPMTSAVQNDGLLDINLNANTTFANTLTGSGVLQVSNVGTITLTGNNSYTGGTVLSAGASLVAGSNNAIGTGAITSNGTALNPASFATANNAVLPSLTITGGTTKLMSSITTTGAQSYADLVLGSNVTLTTSNANISLLGKVDSAVNKTNSLVINAGTGNVTIADSIGSVARFNHLAATGRFIYILADVLTGMTQTYNGSTLIGDMGLLGRTPVVGFLFTTRSSYFQYQSSGRTSSIEYLNTNPIYIRTLITEDPEVTFNGTVNDVTPNTHTLLIAAVAPTQPANNAAALNGAASINFNQAVGAEAPLYSVNLQTILSTAQPNSSDVYLGMISMVDSIATYKSQFYRANMMQGQSSSQAASTVTFSVWDPTATVTTYLLPLQTTANSNCSSTCGQMNLQNTGGRQDAIVINGSNNFMSVRNSTGINNWGTRATQNNALGYVPSPARNTSAGLTYDLLRVSRRAADMHRNNENKADEKKAVVSVGEAQVEGGSQDCQSRRRDDKGIEDTECRLQENI